MDIAQRMVARMRDWWLAGGNERRSRDEGAKERNESTGNKVNYIHSKYLSWDRELDGPIPATPGLYSLFNGICLPAAKAGRRTRYCRRKRVS